MVVFVVLGSVPKERWGYILSSIQKNYQIIVVFVVLGSILERWGYILRSIDKSCPYA